jgi:hypothetical protein
MQCGQLHAYKGWLGIAMCPQERQMYQFPPALADMTLGLSPSRQYGHRIGSGVMRMIALIPATAAASTNAKTLSLEARVLFRDAKTKWSEASSGAN